MPLGLYHTRVAEWPMLLWDYNSILVVQEIQVGMGCHGWLLPRVLLTLWDKTDLRTSKHSKVKWIFQLSTYYN